MSDGVRPSPMPIQHGSPGLPGPSSATWHGKVLRSDDMHPQTRLTALAIGANGTWNERVIPLRLEFLAEQTGMTEEEVEAVADELVRLGFLTEVPRAGRQRWRRFAPSLPPMTQGRAA